MSAPIKIRAHHLLCMQGFQGYGYSEAFVSHMEKILAIFEKDPHTYIQIVADSDEICRACPHNHENHCHKDSTADERIKRGDQNILEQTQIRSGSIDTIQHATALVNHTFGTQGQVARICTDCLWRDTCTSLTKL